MTRLHLDGDIVFDVAEEVDAVVALLRLGHSGFMRVTRMGQFLWINKAKVIYIEGYEPDDGAPLAPDYADSAE